MLKRALAVFALLVGACGTTTGVEPTTGQPAPTTAPTTAATTTPTTAAPTTTAPAFPVTVETADGPVTIPARPEAIVSLSPTATEMLFAIGAGPQVVAVDDQSNYPPEAPMTELSGFTPNVEAIAGYSPDLVVLSGASEDLLSALEALQVPTLILPAASDLDDVYLQLDQLGAATGHSEQAQEQAAQMQADIEALVGSVETPAEPLTYYHELDPTFFTATSNTFIGSIYSLFGLENIADPAETSETGGFPQLSAEFIIGADPDLVFLADTKCCGESAETVAARPGWSGITAVANGAVVELDDDIASRWGPRVVDFVEAIAQAVEEHAT